MLKKKAKISVFLLIITIIISLISIHIPTTPKIITVENDEDRLNQISAPKLNDAPVVEIWNIQSGATTTETVAISEDGDYTALLTNSNITLFDKSSNIPMWTYTQLGLNSLGMSGDGKYILSSRNGFACLLNNSIESPKTEVWICTMSAVVSTTSISESGEDIVFVYNNHILFFNNTYSSVDKVPE